MDGSEIMSDLLNHFADARPCGGDVQPALGGDFFAAFGHQAARIRHMPQRDVDHLNDIVEQFWEFGDTITNLVTTTPVPARPVPMD